mgnify:FL=1
MTVGTNKIVPTISIPYPLGDPQTSNEEQYKLRYKIVRRALEALTEEITEQMAFKV